MTIKAQDSPRDMPAIQYAGWLCENRLAIPKSKSLLEIIELAIKSVASSRYRDEKWKTPEFSAFCWLDRQCEYALMAGHKINHLFFMNGDYNEVDPVKKQLPQFTPCGNCEQGWVYKTEVRYGMNTQCVVACDCRKRWINENRSK